jgi:uncharacterized membrane protein YdbT with pleckstrin-like domain
VQGIINLSKSIEPGNTEKTYQSLCGSQKGMSMGSQDDKEQELQRREVELRKRELEIRLRELDAEINPPPLYETVRHQEPEKSTKRWLRQMAQVSKFMGVVVAVIVAIKIASWLATIVMIGGVAWVAYQIFLANDSTTEHRPKSK